MNDQESPPDKDEHNLAMLAHLLALLGFVIPGMNILVPLLIWLIKRDESNYVAHHSRESLNFQITLTLLVAIWIALKLAIIGLFLLPLVPVIVVTALILMIRAALKASAGDYYRYPFCLRLVK